MLHSSSSVVASQGRRAVPVEAAMRLVILCSLLMSASLACDGGRSVDPCPEPLLLPQSGGVVDLDSIPGDSLVGALLSWTDGSVPPGEADRLRAMGIEIVHVFHYQPLILVYASGDQLRTLAQSESTLVIDVDTPTRAILEACL